MDECRHYKPLMTPSRYVVCEKCEPTTHHEYALIYSELLLTSQQTLDSK